MKISTLKKLIKSIKALGCLCPYPVKDFIKRNYGSGTYLSQVEFHLVDHCNLNCACCNHFTPVTPEYFFSIEDIVSDFKKLKKIFDNIGKIFILGGEPLLHPDLTELFEPLRKIYPKSEIVIITNGILLEKMGENFWSALKKYNIALSMTKYPIKVDYEKFIQKCDMLGIKSYFFNASRFRMKKMNLDPEGRSDKNCAFNKCHEKKCHFLRDSKLYVCTAIPNIPFLNRHFGLNFEITKRDYIDLDKIKSATRINAIFKQPVDFCRYCNVEEDEYVDYSVSKKELGEWVRAEK